MSPITKCTSTQSVLKCTKYIPLCYITGEKETQVLEFCNFDLEHIVTPVDAHKLESLLIQSGYDKKKTQFLVQGFKTSFDLGFEKPRGIGRFQRYAPNLKLRVGSKLELWNKVMKEVELKRFTGPYDKVPFIEFIQSPIGLDPKDKGKKTMLIFHLLYPRNDSSKSVNTCMPEHKCSVHYPDFFDAVQMCIKAGVNCHVTKSDMSSAFRHVPLKVGSFPYLVMKAQHTTTGKWFYFVDKCLPFGSSSSCTIFQAFLNAVVFIVQHKTGKDLVNCLDDYLFAAFLKAAVIGR